MDKYDSLNDNMNHGESSGPSTRTAKRRKDQVRHSNVESQTNDGSDDLEAEYIGGQLKNSNTIFKIRKCNIREFKNRFNEEDGRHVLDVLVSGDLVEHEEREEQRIREKLSGYRKDKSHSSTRSKDSKAEVAAKEANLRANKAIRNEQKDRWIQRIRIQSPALLAILAKLHEEAWSSLPRTYTRPFTTLIYFQSRMKEKLQDLEARWGADLGHAASPATKDADTDMDTDEETEENPVDNCPEALKAMRCFAEFFDSEVLPDYHQFENLGHDSDACVRFNDLAYLFHTGDTIYRPPEGAMSRMREFRQDKRIWRTYQVRIPNVTLQSRSPQEQHRKYQGGEIGLDPNGESTAFIVYAYYIEYNGEEFISVTKSFPILPYDGAVPVISLPVFPLHFVPNPQELVKSSSALGEKVLRHLFEERLASYNAWSVMRTPAGDPIIADGSTGASSAEDVGVMTAVQHAEHINSEVMVDFSEAFQAFPGWKPRRRVLRGQSVVQEIAHDEFPILWWSSPNRDRLLGETFELVPLRTGVCVWQSNKFLRENPLLRTMADNDSRGQLTTRDDLDPVDRILLTGRVFAYVFTERKFAQLEAGKLRPSGKTADALESLRIPNSVKDIIHESIEGHLLLKAFEKQRGEGDHSLDLIQGKGAGLFILLHGVPGVGKTATAEAIAQAHGKPLFKITCGDLGLTPGQVERNLREIFRLASLWDCILLLDEVDTFFSQRSKADAAMHKNALVSVFLRILDYYTGILFLTTNRAGALDEAFKSRIHHKIYYPPLTRRQTLEIWQINIDRLRRIEREAYDTATGLVSSPMVLPLSLDAARRSRLRPLEIPEREIMRFAADQFDHYEARRRHGVAQWNGRQIRNAFQVARSLAYATAYTEAAERAKTAPVGDAAVEVIIMPTPTLQVRHFELMTGIQEEFDAYMLEVYNGQDDGRQAKESEHRADDFVPGGRRHVRFGHRDHGIFDMYGDYYHDGRPHRFEESGGPGWRKWTSATGNAEPTSPNFNSSPELWHKGAGHENALSRHWRSRESRPREGYSDEDSFRRGHGSPPGHGSGPRVTRREFDGGPWQHQVHDRDRPGLNIRTGSPAPTSPLGASGYVPAALRHAAAEGPSTRSTRDINRGPLGIFHGVDSDGRDDQDYNHAKNEFGKRERESRV